jgi:maltose alpha-D-glucosyltransferase/alpha-amylase
VRNVIHVRKAHPVFGLGSIRVLPTDDESVLAFVRDYAGSGTSHGDRPEQVLCVFSFAHNPVSVTIDFDGWYGAPLRDLFGGGDFPSVSDDGHLTLTLGTQSFYWLQIGDATR